MALNGYPCLIGKNSTIDQRPVKRDADVVSIVAAEYNVLGVCTDSCCLKDIAKPHSLPPGCAHQVSPDLVADTLQRRVFLDGRKRKQLSIGYVHRSLH